MIQHPLFVYGTLMSDQRAFYRLAPAVTRSVRALLPDAQLFAVSWYPVAVSGAGQVHGEVHWLTPGAYAAVLADLDAYEGDEYERVVRTVTTAAGTPVDAWVYLGATVTTPGLTPITHGDWRRFHGR